MTFDLVHAVDGIPPKLTVWATYAQEIKTATSHFEFIFLQISNLDPDSPATISAKNSLAEAYEKTILAIRNYYFPNEFRGA